MILHMYKICSNQEMGESVAMGNGQFQQGIWEGRMCGHDLKPWQPMANTIVQAVGGLVN